MACHSRSQHEDARRSEGPGGGHQKRKHAGQGIGGHENRLVARDGGHGGERVHALGARDARDQLDGEDVHAAGGEFGTLLRGGERLREADDVVKQQRGELEKVSRMSTDEAKDLLMRQIYLDTAQLAKIVMDMPDVDPKRVGAKGPIGTDSSDVSRCRAL